MPVALLELNTQNLALEEELKSAFARVLRSGHFIMGPEVEAFEDEMARLTGGRHALAISSGTDAILLALMSLGIGSGDEVICPSFTFFATAGCVSRVGATPVFADVNEKSFNIDVDDAARKITARTKAIIPVHLFGQMADMDGVMKFAREHGLAVIEDAAQALGAKDEGRQAGTVGTFGAFSFFPSKNLGGFGDGGLLTTNDGELAEQARILRVHGAKPKYYHRQIGANFRMDALQCALLRAKLPHYATYTQGRRKNAAWYCERLKGAASTGAIMLPSEEPGKFHIWNQFTLRVSEGKRDRLREHLAARGIGSEIYYPVPLHQQECFANLGGGGSLPVSERLAIEVLSIPVYPELREEQLAEVAKAIQEWTETR